MEAATEPVASDDLHQATTEQPSFTMSRESWRRLFREVGDGQRAALAALYDAAARRLYGLALWRTRSREDAAEVVQEVFVRLAEGRGGLAAVADPRAWLLTVTHRAAIDLTRRRARRTAAALDDCLLLEGPAPDHDRELDGVRASRLLAALPAAQRDVIYLKHYADCSFAEAATITGVPTFTAASRYRSGIKKLRQLMAEPRRGGA